MDEKETIARLMGYCIDCKHHRKEGFIFKQDVCKHPSLYRRSPVDGKVYGAGIICEARRLRSAINVNGDGSCKQWEYRK